MSTIPFKKSKMPKVVYIKIKKESNLRQTKANKNMIMNSYEEAMKKKYSFYSYGDSMLII